MVDSISDVAHRLAENAEAVCRHYLPNGRREGRYWLVGDVHNTPGRSLYVRLSGSACDDRAVGSWTDAAADQHGDLLDLIAAARRLDGIGAALDEARRFLGLAPSAPSHRHCLLPAGPPRAKRSRAEPRWPPSRPEQPKPRAGCSRGPSPIAGTLASTYLEARGIAVAPDMTALRFHPRCWYRRETDSPEDARDTWPALIAAVTDRDGAVTGVQRTWLDPSGCGKAPVTVPRRALGHLLGHAVRFGTAGDVMAAGEGIETMLSLRQIMPALPLAAALSATNLAGLLFPPGLRRLYIVRDNDPAGRRADETLTARAQAERIEVLTLAPALKDFNDDLRHLGTDALAASVQLQLAPEDVTRFWMPAPRDARLRSAWSGATAEGSAVSVA